MSCLPVIHFYYDSITPFKKMKSDHSSHNTPKWWGIEVIGAQYIDGFKSKPNVEM